MVGDFLTSVNGYFIGYAAIFALSALICFGCIPRATRIDAPDIRWGLQTLLATSGGWATAHVGYLLAPTPALQEGLFVLGLIIGFAAVGPWLYFCSAYSGRTLHRNRTIRFVAVGVFVIVLSIKATNPLHRQYFSTELVATPFPHLAITHEPLHWVVMGLAYALAFIGFFMLFELFNRVSYNTKPLFVIVGLTGIPVFFDLLGATSPTILDLTYSPIGVAAFAVGVFYIYFDRFQTVRLADETADASILVDADNHVHESNTKARDLFPQLNDGVGKPLDEVVPEVSRRLTESGAIVERQQHGSSRYFALTVNPFSGNQTRLGQLITLSDITEREQYRSELERKNKRLEEFASLVSHDLRNPLTVAQGRLALARESVDNEHLEKVEQAHERIELLIEDLLVLAREGQLVDEAEVVDLAAFTEECWENVNTQAGTLINRGESIIIADQSRLRQVFENLFRNAIEHGGSTVTVTVGSLDDGFYIEDNCPGIHEEHRDNIFDLGYSTNEAGTGFGLGIVKEIVEAHGWTIHVTEGGEGGARFEIRGVTEQEE